MRTIRRETKGGSLSWLKETGNQLWEWERYYTQPSTENQPSSAERIKYQPAWCIQLEISMIQLWKYIVFYIMYAETAGRA